MSSLAKANDGRALTFVWQPSTAAGFCFEFSGTLTAEDFFQGIPRTETPGGIEFVKGSRSLRYFPENLEITIHPLGVRCREGSTARSQKDEEPAIELMSALHLEVYWKEGTSMKAVREVSPKALTLEEAGDLIPSNLMTEPGKVWTYHLNIKDDQVPLRSHIIVVITSSDGRTIARLSAGIG